MYYNFRTEISSSLLSKPESLFDTFLGESFAYAMEDCFYCNPMHVDYNGGVPLDNVMDLPLYLAAVRQVCILGNKNFYKSAISNFFKKNDPTVIDPFAERNQIAYESIRDRVTISYNNVEKKIVLAIIWGAYFYTCLKAEYEDNKIHVRDFLYQFLIQKAACTKEDFERHNILSQLFREYYRPTLEKILKQNPKELVLERSKDADLDNLQRLRNRLKEFEKRADKDESIEKAAHKETEVPNQSKVQEEEESSGVVSRLKIAYILQLMKITNKEQVENERALCRVLKTLTGASRTSVQTYLNSFTLDVSRNKTEIEKFNKDLQQLKLPILTTQLTSD